MGITVWGGLIASMGVDAETVPDKMTENERIPDGIIGRLYEHC